MIVGIKKLSRYYSEKNGTSLKKSQEIIESVIECIEESIIKDGTVQIIDHFTLERVLKQAHKGTNPLTGEPMIIPERTTLRVVTGKGLLKKLNNK